MLMLVNPNINPKNEIIVKIKLSAIKSFLNSVFGKLINIIINKDTKIILKSNPSVKEFTLLKIASKVLLLNIAVVL